MIEYIQKYLGPSKITLDIKTNKYEEIYEYSDEKYDFFDKIENIMDMYTHVKTNRSPVGDIAAIAVVIAPPTPRTSRITRDELPAAPITRPAEYRNGGGAIGNGGGGAIGNGGGGDVSAIDAFIYCILLSLDNTLSLIPDKNIFIQKFKFDLINKFNNYETLLKKMNIEKNDIITAIKSNNNREALYKYMSIILKKSIIIQKNNDIYLCEPNKKIKPNGLWICENTLAVHDLNYEAYKEKYYNNRKNYYLSDYISSAEKLNTLLVKDLKEVAESLGLETTIIDTESGKRKNLLKDNLKEIIKTNLFPSI